MQLLRVIKENNISLLWLKRHSSNSFSCSSKSACISGELGYAENILLCILILSGHHPNYNHCWNTNGSGTDKKAWTLIAEISLAAKVSKTVNAKFPGYNIFAALRHFPAPVCSQIHCKVNQNINWNLICFWWNTSKRYIFTQRKITYFATKSITRNVISNNSLKTNHFLDLHYLPFPIFVLPYVDPEISTLLLREVHKCFLEGL